ncbi:Integrase catalytic domain-containing protein [Citrus sinensis]|uniref:Integrase catalytic domain-containing protein n=1 Tax=Citrus sinensis TaxID=2711 RepID=A0ACB8JN63_CITSI|nr:Integrase catalytic domain-containing protein [Citrus sinensis]
MVEGETSRIGERSTETISGDTSGGRSCLTKEVKYLVKDEECAMTLWRTLEEKYLLKSPENCLHAMSQVYGFEMKSGVSMHDHVSRFEKLLADLKNLDEDIKDESVIVFKDVCTALTSLEIQNNDKNSERASSEDLVSRDWAMEKHKKRGGKNSRSKSRSRIITRDECTFCHEKGHWRKDCPKTQKRDGKKPATANMARKDEDFDYSLSITPAAYVASSSEWILDTGATYHLCPIKEWFTDFRNLESSAVVMGNDQPCRTVGIGTIRLKMFDGMVRELKKVRFVLALKKNLISVGALEAKGYKVTIEDGIIKFTHGAMVILQGVRLYNLYYLKRGTTDETNVAETHSDTTELWHIRLRHAGEKYLQTLMRHELLKGTKTCKLNFCEHCVVGKKTRVKFGTANHDTRDILEYVHNDVWGPTKTASIDGSHYFVTFVDDFSRRVWVYTMRAKDENGGIKRHFTVRHAPQQNGVAERMNRTLLEKVQCMLSNASLDKKFWAEAVSYASHLVNRLPSAAIGGKTLMEMWSGKHAQDYDSLRIFGCPAYYNVKDGKLDSRARKAIFVGFKDGVKGFKLWDLEDKKFVCSRDVTFDEASMMKASSSQQVENKTKEVLQWVEFDATLYVPVSSTSKKGSTMEVTLRVEEEARLVAKGFAQKEGIDYNEVFSPVVKHTSIRILLALVAEYELELTQLDVKTAYLHGDLEEKIYMIQPCGFRVAGKENNVCRLIKSLYGLKQSPRQWYKRFDQFIQGHKFTRSEHDHCVYFRRLPDGAFIYLLLYVDDMLIASKNRDEIERLKKQLASEFEMKDLGDAQRIRGIEIHRDKKNGSVWLTQKSYLKKVLERFGMDNKTKPVCTLLAPHFKLSSSSCPRSQEERDYMARVPYASAVGSLMYVMDCGQQCVGYCDSDFAGDLDKRRSTTGYVFTLGGGLVSWRSILQSTIVLSTTKAEYMAATEAVKEVIWLKGLLGDLGVIQENIAVFCDNQSAIFLANNQTYHARTKHIDVKYHYVREIIESGVVLLRKIDTKDNPSDMLTKVVSGVKFQHCLKLIQILRLC